MGRKKTYIVHMDRYNMPTGFQNQKQWYHSSLKSVSSSANMLYTYNTVIHGYATYLTVEEAKLLEELPGVLSVQEDAVYKLHTTRSPKFLGIGKIDAMFSKMNISSENIVVGVMDTGVWPESKSFDDTGMRPVPSRWKGKCVTAKNFSASSCNRKLIGARFFPKSYEATFGPVDPKQESRSPRDDQGHGTHTSSTIAGSAVPGAKLFDYGSGTARGMAKQARVAMYKVCWLGGICMSSDIVAGMEKAIEDGVHIISASLGGGPRSYYNDTVAIAAFRATSQGIFVSCSAGNEGPLPESLSNIAPWMTTVGAGTIDRDFPAYISLGNEQIFTGISLYGGKQLSASMAPLVYAGNLTHRSNTELGAHSKPSGLNPEEVRGKIVLCDAYSICPDSFNLKDAGAAGIIQTVYSNALEHYVKFILPGAFVRGTPGEMIKYYTLSDSKPVASIKTGNTEMGVKPSPTLAAFSSRGPHQLTPEILKPDILAPGLAILASWTRNAGPSDDPRDTRRVDFNIISGTSMSCPHISGIASLVMAAHPKWSPAAVRSALMTTAYSTYQNGLTIQDASTQAPSTAFDIGAGYVNPEAALDPGLVYDATVDDYVDYLCATNYTAGMIKIITGKNITCEKGKKYRVENLNYPSFAVPFRSYSSAIKYSRTLKNVGKPATYKAFVFQEPTDVKIQVEPMELTFSELNEKKNYTLTFTPISKEQFGTTSFARLTWTDGKHVVSSPIAFSWI